MAEKIGDSWDYDLKYWALHKAVEVNRKGTPAKKIIKDAELYYNFMVPKKAELFEINSKTNKNKN